MPRFSFAKVSTAALKKELHRRLEALPKLIAERDALSRQIADLEAAALPEKPIAQPTRPVPRKSEATANTTISLTEALVQVMSGKKCVSIPEAVAGVLAAGYKSTAKNFSKMLGTMLAADDRFQRVARGIPGEGLIGYAEVLAWLPDLSGWAALPAAGFARTAWISRSTAVVWSLLMPATWRTCMANNPLLEEFAGQAGSYLARLLTEVFDRSLPETDDVAAQHLKAVLEVELERRTKEAANASGQD